MPADVHVTAEADTPMEEGTSLWLDAWYRLKKNRLALIGAGLLCVIVALSIAGPWFSPYTYDEQNRALGATGPSMAHPFGTDLLGRDQLTRIFHGGRISLLVGISATGVALLIGVLYGATAGYLGGRVDSVMMRVVDVLYALPFTITVIILMVYFGHNILLLFLAIGAVEWLTMARIVRGQVMSLRKKEFVEAAEIMGLPRRTILLRHIVPNTLGPVIVYATLTIPSVMILEAFLSFLGLGVQPPMSSWGILIKEGVETMQPFWWMLIFPSIALGITLFAFNFFGDGLRDALDPRSARD